jgi:hypothetical protein
VPVHRPAGSRRKSTPLIAAGLGLVAVAAVVAALMTGGGDDGGGVGDPDPITDPASGDPGGVSPPGGPLPAPPTIVDTPTAGAGGATPPAEPAGQRGAPPATGGDATRTDPPVATPPPPPPPPPPAPPADGRLVLGTTLPAGATVTLRAADGRSYQFQGEPLALPPGRYRAELRAPGYSPINDDIQVGAGETVRWTREMTAVPRPTPPPPPPPPPPARTDPPEADVAAELARAEQAVRGRLAALATAFESRSMDQVIALYPSAPADWRNRWAAMVENPQAVRELNASITSVDDFQMNGDAATVRFTLHLEFRDYRNAEQELNAPYTGTLRRSGDIWVIAELR